MTSVEPDAELLHPLTYFCRKGGHPLPVHEIIAGAAMPEPYRTLLVHDGDMTSRLEEHYGAPMRLRVLQRELAERTYRREVLLCAQDSGTPVEYGAIEIALSAFDEALREQILDGRQPLGSLLHQQAIVCRSAPRAFLRFAPDPVIDAHFHLPEPRPLFGRCNVLCNEQGVRLAQIVEVLRP